MISVSVSVRFPGDWTEELRNLGVWGDIYSAALHHQHYLGVNRLQGEGVEEAIQLMRSTEYHTDVDVVRLEERDGVPNATVFTEAEMTSLTPYTALLEQGYMPLDPTLLTDGREVFTVLIRHRTDFQGIINALEESGVDVQIEKVLTDIDTPTQPTVTAWMDLQQSLTDRQWEILATAFEQGYFEVPRRADLGDVAEAVGIHKSTASEHMRRAFYHIVSFMIDQRGF